MANSMASVFRNALELYEYLCRPVCESAGIQQGEFNILLFLANNPGKNTAMDIHRCGGMKQSMISTLVEKLVQGGYLERQPIPGDRRKVKLICTEKAEPIIEAGQTVQKRFTGYLLAGASQSDLDGCARIKELMEQNILDCRDKMLKGELE